MNLFTSIVIIYDMILMFVGYMADDTNQIIVYGFLAVIMLLCAIGTELNKIN